jgi:hypothetical protein
VATTLLLSPAAISGCGAPSADAVVGSAVARTEAAGSARFVLNTSADSPVTTASGTVDFAKGQLAMVVNGSMSAPGKVSMEVRQIGDVEYSFVPLSPLNAAGWSAQRLPRELNALQFPLYAFSPADKAVAVGRGTFSGVRTTEFEIKMPGGTHYGVHVAPYSVNLWIDSRGRIREALQVETETGVPGHKGTIMSTSSVDFTDFGLPVHVQVPDHYTSSLRSQETTLLWPRLSGSTDTSVGA